MKKIIPLFLLLSFFAVQAQNTVGTLLNTNDSFDGYVLFSPRTASSSKNTYLINNCGEIINQWPSTFSVFSTDYLMSDGSLFRSVIDNQSTLALPGNTGRIEHLDWDGNLIWGLTLSDTDFSFHHDYVVLSNGNIVMLVAYRRSEADAIAEGRNPSTIATGELYEERILEIEPVGTDSYNIVWEWHSWDHLIQDFDITKNNYDPNVANHPEKVDMNFGISLGEADWWHSNSLSYSPERDQVLISNRNHDEFIIIDHSTTTAEATASSGGNSNMGGDLLYRWGNPISYRQGNASDQKTFGQHDVHFIPAGVPDAGKIMIFNNGDTRTFTTIQIIDPDFDSTTQTYVYSGGAYGPTVPEWEYIDPVNPDNFYAAFLSGAQQLPNGNVLVCNGPKGELFEIDPSFNTVWRYQSPVGNSGILSDGQDPATQQTRAFRALKYASNYAGFNGQDVTPGNVIETNPFEDNCTLLSVTENSIQDVISIYPTLVDSQLYIESNLSEFNIEIIDLTGQIVKSYKNTYQIDMSFINSGVYFIKIQSENKTTTAKIIKK